MIGAHRTLWRTMRSSVSIRLRRRSGSNMSQRSGWDRLKSGIARSKPSGQRAQCLQTDSGRFGEFRQIISGILYGVSKMACTGCSMSPSARINPACERVMALKTWPLSVTSPSISCAKQPISAPSKDDEKTPGGPLNISKPSLASSHVNLDSQPCWEQDDRALAPDLARFMLEVDKMRYEEQPTPRRS